MKLIVPLDPSSPTFVDDAWLDYATRTTVALLPFTFGSTVSNPIPGEIRFLLTAGIPDPNTGITPPDSYQMSFWDGTQWVSTGTGTGGSGGGTTDDTTVLLSGGTPTFSNSYSITRNADNTPLEETWTDTSTSRLRRRMGYSYASGRVSSIRTRVYSSVNGTTVTGDMTETFTYNYSTGLVSSSITVRTV